MAYLRLHKMQMFFGCLSENILRSFEILPALESSVEVVLQLKLLWKISKPSAPVFVKASLSI